MRTGDTSGPRTDHTSVDVLAMYRAHVTEVYRYVSRLTAGDRSRTEDLTQAVFERVARTLAGGGAIPTPPIAWLLTVARNEFLQTIRHDRREHRRLERVTSWPTATDDADDADEAVARRLALRQAMAELSDEQRAALVFRDQDDLPVRAVAELLGRSIEATESLLVRAKRRARDAVQEAGHGA